MNKVPNRKKLRREYLSTKRRLNLIQIVGFMVLMPSTLMPLLLIMASILLLRYSVLYSCATLVALAVWLLIVRWGWRALMEVEKRERSLAYVPPATPNTLPAEEILLRSSQVPAVEHSSVLLRAARGGETPEEQLLRATAELADTDRQA